MFETRVLIAPWILAMLALAQPAMADDLAAGRAKAESMCGNCHGVNGAALLPGAANLGGQQKEYLREQLRAFRSGARQNAQMTYIAKPLTDADIEDLSTWYSSIKVTLEMPQ